MSANSKLDNMYYAIYGVVVEVREGIEDSFLLAGPSVEYRLVLLNGVVEVGAGDGVDEQQCFLIKFTGRGRLAKVKRLFSTSKSNFDGKNFPRVTVVMKGGRVIFSPSVDCCIFRCCGVSEGGLLLLRLNVVVVVVFAVVQSHNDVVHEPSPF